MCTPTNSKVQLIKYEFKHKRDTPPSFLSPTIIRPVIVIVPAPPRPAKDQQQGSTTGINNRDDREES
jgi:hypothetical protein